MMKILLFIIIFLPYSLHAQNVRVQDFSDAKKILNKAFPAGETIYCGCPFQGKIVDTASCGYQPQRLFTKSGKFNKRSQSVEWEHVVPAHAFGQSFPGWRNPESFLECKKLNGKYLSGRDCARKTSTEFSRMEADLYNIHPEIGELNGLRSNYSMSEIPGEAREFGRCDVELVDRKFEPRESVKGDVARIYLYMEWAYPGRGIVSDKNKALFEAWSKKDPVSEEERKRAEKIRIFQGNCNPFVLNCK